MRFPRASGILLHITSLPGGTGIGDLGKGAYHFADFLKSTGQCLWQVLPLGPTGYGNSPYQGLSFFAGNPLLISLEKLADAHFLDPSDLAGVPSFPPSRVDYDAVINFKLPLLKKSCVLFEQRATPAQKQELAEFQRQNSNWLDGYSLYMALKEAHGLTAWNTWEDGIRKREPSTVKYWANRLSHEIKCHQYQQFQFHKQWQELKAYCRKLDIKFIGDLPIFVSLDSAEAWLNPEIFQLDDKGKPVAVAGVPPDYFSETGQLWGNPLYRWQEMAKNGYHWWLERFRATRERVDIIRLDHFRGFESYWEIPANEITAVHGHWVPGPGTGLFSALERAFGELPIIAEDLGVITPEVEALREQLGFPGMKVLQFAFAGDAQANSYLPHNYPRNCVVYTGTHDNNTTLGWFRDEDNGASTLSREEAHRERHKALKYTGTDGREINWDFIRLAMMSVADTVIIPLQDILSLGSNARMNVPGTTAGNWIWRLPPGLLIEKVRARLKEMTLTYGR